MRGWLSDPKERMLYPSVQIPMFLQSQNTKHILISSQY